MTLTTLHLTVGLPGTGKTTAARRIEVELRALRFTKDEWVKALYGCENPPSASDVIEGRLVQIGLRALELGVSVVIDFGLWAETSARPCGRQQLTGAPRCRCTTSRLTPQSSAGASTADRPTHRR